MSAKDSMRSMYTDGTRCASKAELDQYRPSYANMMMRHMRYGLVPNSELAGEDRPESIAALYEASSKWLGI